MVTLAIRKCHIMGIKPIPLLFIIDIDAVKSKDNRVIIPRYIIRGFPRIE